MPNLWDPHAGLAFGAILLTALLLGMVHGITPDEHTWPITFSYAIGSYSTKKGIVAGLTFSAAFTLQRAMASELAYLALDKWFTLGSTVDYIVYIIVGALMIWAAQYISGGRHFHLFNPRHGHDPNSTLQDPRPWMPAVHGFIAGWGLGAFAIIIYSVLAPAMPSPWLAWLPGALFGVGTTIVQALAGGIFGWISRSLGLTTEDIRRVSLKTASNTLGWGGLVFVAGGALGLLVPNIAGLSVDTGIQVHNLGHLGISMVLVMVTVVVIGIGTLTREIRRAARRHPRSALEPEPSMYTSSRALRESLSRTGPAGARSRARQDVPRRERRRRQGLKTAPRK